MVPRVLVIEPYSDLRQAILLTLRREHYACDAVAEVSEAAQELGEHAYACVVVDAPTTRTAVTTLDPMATVVLLHKPFGREELIAAVG